MLAALSIQFRKVATSGFKTHRQTSGPFSHTTTFKVHPQVRSYGLSSPDLSSDSSTNFATHFLAKPLDVGVQEHHRQIQAFNALRLLPWKSAEGVKSPHSPDSNHK